MKNLVSVIIPGYNEAAVVAGTVAVVEQTMRAIGKPFEILVVDDGSTDSTVAILKGLVKKYRNLRFISYKDGPSRRENLAKSFKLLKGEYVLLLDMDLSLDVRYLKDMLYWLEHGYGMVIANRYHKQSRIRRHVKRYVISKLYNLAIRMLFRTGFKDNICGFKAFKRSVVMKLVKEAGIDETRRRSVFWDTQMLILALRNSVRVKEIPVQWTEGKNSALSFGREKGMLPYILEFWLKGR